MYSDLYKKFQEIENKVNVFSYKLDKLFLYEDMIINQTATDICRDAIQFDFIKEVFDEAEIEGYFVMCNLEYVGFVMFKKNNDCIEIKLIGSNKTKDTKGLPIGQFLIDMVEKEANECGINSLFANSVPSAIEFYLNTGWNFYNMKDEEYFLLSDDEEQEDTYEVEKILNKCEIKRKDDTFGIQDDFAFISSKYDIENPRFIMPSKSLYQQINDFTYFILKKLYY